MPDQNKCEHRLIVIPADHLAVCANCGWQVGYRDDRGAWNALREVEAIRPEPSPYPVNQSAPSPAWISVKDALPERCVNVIVLGFMEKVNVCRQAWHARLWGKCEDGRITWITPCDALVDHVSHWMPLPK